MTDTHDQAHLLVQQAMIALSHHHDDEARGLARQAAQLAPDLESVWLVMAAVSSPNAAEIYLQKALEINPQSDRARKGLEWVKQQKYGQISGQVESAAQPQIEKAQTQQPEIIKSVESQPSSANQTDAIPYPAQAVFPPIAKKAAKGKRLQKSPDYQNIESKRLYSRQFIIWPWILMVIAICLGAAIWMVIPPIQNASASDLHANRQPGEIVKPSHTPTPTATPTMTPTPTNTSTPSPTPTETATPLPTDTAVPEDETDPEYVYSVDEFPDVGKKERWIDVDLSSQTVAAYQGKELLVSFLVSTGTSAHPTITGRFHIYVKYRYTDMAGPGYYLPDVPYTMYFHDGYGLHGTYWHSNFGTPMSHGCINLRTEDAAWLYDWADEGTLVNVHY